VYGYESHLTINGKRSNIRPKDFYVLVDLMQVNRKTFNKAASLILSCYTDKLPAYFDKLEKIFPDVLFSKRKWIHSFGRNEQRVVKSMSLADKMRQNHQIRIKQLKKNGWYTEL
jgi:serine/threonine-protein kinase HipA